jgi:hypothetical protein
MTEASFEPSCQVVSLEAIAVVRGDILAMTEGDRVCEYAIGDAVCPLVIRYDYDSREIKGKDRILNPDGGFTPENIGHCLIRRTRTGDL